jgi:two-component system LytT family response regulator
LKCRGAIRQFLNQDDDVNYHVIVVEDEPANRTFVSQIVEQDSELILQAACSSVVEARDALKSGRPDLMLLDIQLSQDTVFSLLNDPAFTTLDPLPTVVFITAYDQYAVKAFELHAVDYILKPFGRERLKQALVRAKERLKNSHTMQQFSQWQALMDQLTKAPPTASQSVERLQVKSDGKVWLIPVPEVVWLEAKGNYVQLHTNDAKHKMRDTLTALEARLAPYDFVRTHRSILVNLSHVQAFEPWFNGDYVILMHNGEKLKLSRRYKDHLSEKLGGTL